MTITYRGTGAWGAGKGANLTAAEVDGNFYDLATRLTSLETDPATGIGISAITVSGDKFTVTLSDGSVLGPFQLPTASLAWAGEWTADTSYDAFDIFLYDEPGGQQRGVYLVLQDYLAPSTFDPAESNTTGPFLSLLFPINPVGRVLVSSLTDAYTLDSADAGTLFLVDQSGGAFDITAPDDLTDIEVGTVFSFLQVDATQVQVVGGSTDVTLWTAETTKTRKQFSMLAVTKVDADTWLVSGDLELAV